MPPGRDRPRQGRTCWSLCQILRVDSVRLTVVLFAIHLGGGAWLGQGYLESMCTVEDKRIRLMQTNPSSIYRILWNCTSLLCFCLWRRHAFFFQTKNAEHTH